MESWLFDIGLEIENYQQELANGYILGSILYRYDRQPDFGQFINKPHFSAANCQKLVSPLTQLKLKIDTQKLIRKQTNYAKRLVQKLYVALHTQAVLQLKEAKRHKPAATQARASNQEMMAKHLQKFQQQKARQASKAIQDQKAALQKKQNEQQAIRQEHLHNLKANQQFMQQWDRQGWRNWKANQQKKQDRLTKTHQLRVKLATDYKQIQLDYIDDNDLQVQQGIDEFEKNMMRLGIDHTPQVQETTKKKMNLQTQAAVTMSHIRQNKIKNVQAAKQREIRMRKMHAEQEKEKKLDRHRIGGSEIAERLGILINLRQQAGFSSIFKRFKSAKKHQQVLMAVEDLSMQRLIKWGPIEQERQRLLRETDQKRHQ